MNIPLPRQWRMTGMGVPELSSPEAGAPLLVGWLRDTLPSARQESDRLLDMMYISGWSAYWDGRRGGRKTLRIESGGMAWHVTLRPGVGQTVRSVEPLAADWSHDAANDAHV